MPSVQNVIFKASKQVSLCQFSCFSPAFSFEQTIVHTPPWTCHMKVCLFYRSMRLDLTPHLCTTTGSGIPTGPARSMESFQGNKLQLHLSNFPISCIASWEKSYQRFYSKCPNYVGKEFKMVYYLTGRTSLDNPTLFCFFRSYKSWHWKRSFAKLSCTFNIVCLLTVLWGDLHCDVFIFMYNVCVKSQIMLFIKDASCFLSSFDSVGYLSGAGSDYAAFVHYLGISSIDMSYTYDRVWKKSS